MAKKINAYFDNTEKRIVIVDDHVYKGDYIDLDDLSNFKSFVDNFLDEKFKLKIINEFKASEEFNNLETTINNLKYEMQNIESESKLKLNEAELRFTQSENLIKTKIENDYKKQIEKIESEKNKLIIEYNELKSNFETKKALEIKKIENKYNIESLQKDNEIKELNSKIKTLNESKDLEITNKIHKIKNESDKQIYELQNKLELLERTKSEKNIKLIGEDLEKYCEREYNIKYDGGIDDSTFEKTTNPIDGTKPDFIFKVYAKSIATHLDDKNWLKNHLCGSVVFEMKTELLNSQNKKTNAHHLPKLEKDRIKLNADTAVLVTELEQDDIFLFRRSIDYPNIYIIRPQVFTTFIGIYRNLMKKRTDTVLANIEFLDKQEILSKFDKFKDDLLKNFGEKIEKDCQSIITASETILKKANEIHETANDIIKKNIDKSKKIIDNFKIESKVKKIEKISNN